MLFDDRDILLELGEGDQLELLVEHGRLAFGELQAELDSVQEMGAGDQVVGEAEHRSSK